MTPKYKKARTAPCPADAPTLAHRKSLGHNRPNKPASPPQRLAPSPKAKREFDSLAVDRKQKHRVPKEVFARSKACENFEAEVKKAARQVADADKAVAAADAQIEKADAAAGIARAEACQDQRRPDRQTLATGRLVGAVGEGLRPAQASGGNVLRQGQESLR